MKKMIDISLAGLTFPCALRYPDTARYFPAPDPAAPRVGGKPVCLTDEDWRYYMEGGNEDCAHTEFSLLTAAFSDALMDHDRMIVHAVAIRWRDSAYLIAAHSGVGKSTQAKTLQALRPGEFSIICGDRPALEFRAVDPSEAQPTNSPPLFPDGRTIPVGDAASPVFSAQTAALTSNLDARLMTLPRDKAGAASARVTGDQRDHPQTNQPTPLPLPAQKPPVQWDILVHPSHWNGKENWYGAEAAPLAGVILLRRGEENAVCPLSPREAAIRTYAQVIQLCDNPEKIRKAAELSTRLLSSVPIWQLTTHQVPDSTKLLLDAVFRP